MGVQFLRADINWVLYHFSASQWEQNITAPIPEPESWLEPEQTQMLKEHLSLLYFASFHQSLAFVSSSLDLIWWEIINNCSLFILSRQLITFRYLPSGIFFPPKLEILQMFNLFEQWSNSTCSSALLFFLHFTALCYMSSFSTFRAGELSRHSQMYTITWQLFSIFFFITSK